MPKVLDYNFSVGNCLLNTCLSLLVCCPSQQKYPSEHYPPTYSLWLLEPYFRHSWLLSTLVIMYKYHYDSYPYSRQVQWLITIVLNTLKSQWHKCKLSHEPFLSPLPSRSRDFSTPSADTENIQEKEKELACDIVGSIHEEVIKPFVGSGIKLKSFGARFGSSDRADDLILEQLQKAKDKGERHQWKPWKGSERSSSEGEDAEPELEAIPESPKSENSLQEHFASEFSGETLELACVQLVKDYEAEDQVVVTDPWEKITDQAKLVSRAQVPAKVEEKHNSEFCNIDSSVIIEKAAVESMEKQLNTQENVLNSARAGIHVTHHVRPSAGSEFVRPEARHSDLVSFAAGNHNSSLMTKASAVLATDNLETVKADNRYQPENACPPNLELQSSTKNTSVIQSLSLPRSETGTKSHSKYPRPKLFQSRKKDPQKTVQKTEMLGSESLTVPLFRPPLERLLPIGVIDKEKAKKVDLPSSQALVPFHEQSVECSLQQQSSHRAANDPFPPTRELFEDKGVQAGGGGLPFDLPAPERLLPIGPPPSRKEWYTAPVFRTTFNESSEGSKLLSNPESLKAATEASYASEDNMSPISPLLKNSDKKINTTAEPESKDTKNFATSASPNKLRRQMSVVESGKDNSGLEPDFKLINESPSPSRTSFSKMGRKTCFSFDASNIQLEQQDSQQKPSTVSSFDLFTSCNSVFESKDEAQKKEGNASTEKVFGSHSFQNVSSIAELLQSEKAEVVGFTSDFDLSVRHVEKVSDEEIKCKLPFRQRKMRKPGLASLEPQRSFDHQTAGIRRMRKADVGGTASSGAKRLSTASQSARSSEDFVIERCTECGTVVEEYSDEELGLCVVILATFVHRESSMAAPFLPKMLKVVARIASTTSYPWQSESNVHLPGGSVSVARQFLRCMLHQLAPNDIFSQIFQSLTLDVDFFKTMAAALADFTEVNQVTPLLHVFQNLNDKKHLHHETVFHILDNVACYLSCLPLESSIPPWGLFLQQLETFLRKLIFALPQAPCQLASVLQIMLAALKTPVINNTKSLLDPFSKLLSHAIQHSPLDYQQLVDLCRYCYRNVVKERDKLILTRTAVFELVQALKFKSSVPDANLLILVQFVLEDAGGCLGPNIIIEGFSTSGQVNMYNTSSSECMRQYLNDVLEFVADVHTLNKVKNLLCGSSTHLNEETLGGQLKAGMAQYLAIEISKGNGRDNRAIGRYLPWLYHPPTALQQGPKEFIDCVSHIRLLSWLLLGALTHSSLLQHTASFVCQPIPLEANSHIAEHIQVILAGFAEQSKVSVLHMSSLFHAFILCQLWTMYCEHMVSLNPPGSEQSQNCSLTLTDFWAKVTPGILQLVCHSKVLAEMVSLHFLSLMEALMECKSIILARLLPMWTPVLYSFQGQLPGNLQFRLRSCINCQPPSHTREDATAISTAFLRWLQRLQFKIGQIELQSSTATQFYSL